MPSGRRRGPKRGGIGNRSLFGRQEDPSLSCLLRCTCGIGVKLWNSIIKQMIVKVKVYPGVFPEQVRQPDTLQLWVLRKKEG